METFIRKQLKMKAHWVPKVEETPEGVVVWIDRLGQRLLRCGRYGLVVRQVHSRSPLRRWCHLCDALEDADDAVALILCFLDSQ